MFRLPIFDYLPDLQELRDVWYIRTPKPMEGPAGPMCDFEDPVSGSVDPIAFLGGYFLSVPAPPDSCP